MITYASGVMYSLALEGYWAIEDYTLEFKPSDLAELNVKHLEPTKIGVLGYSVKANCVLWVVMHPSGIVRGPIPLNLPALTTPGSLDGAYYRVFSDVDYRRVASRRLVEDLAEKGMILPEPIMTFGLEIHHSDKPVPEDILTHFCQNGWRLYDGNKLLAC